MLIVPHQSLLAENSYFYYLVQEVMANGSLPKPVQSGLTDTVSIGGEFTRQTEVTFLGNNEKLVIKQKFSGIDEHGHLTISTEMEGRIPEIPSGASVHIEPYTELYHTSSSGKFS